jgi:hypothetical protein
MKSILDPSFRYVSSIHTDLRKTFARIRRERALEQKAKPAKTQPLATIVALRAGGRA